MSEVTAGWSTDNWTTAVCHVDEAPVVDVAAVASQADAPHCVVVLDGTQSKQYFAGNVIEAASLAFWLDAAMRVSAGLKVVEIRPATEEEANQVGELQADYPTQVERVNAIGVRVKRS